MFKDIVLESTLKAIEKAVQEKELGQMESTDGISLVVEKPKNPDFGDFAVNVSSLARNARIAPPMIANAIGVVFTSFATFKSGFCTSSTFARLEFVRLTI